jgi:hypothetical protein
MVWNSVVRNSSRHPLDDSHSCEIRPSWINAVALFIGAVIVFAGFLRDARGVVKRARGEEERKRSFRRHVQTYFSPHRWFPL